MHKELNGEEIPTVEELKIVVDESGKKVRKQRNMERYAPLIFEECYVRKNGSSRIVNTFEID